MKKLIYLTFLALLCSCSNDNDKYNPIPDVHTSFYIDLNSSREKYLREGGQYVTYTRNNPPASFAGSASNVGYRGVVVVSSLVTDMSGKNFLYAYDLACPNDTGESINIETDNGIIKGHCPKCDGKYELVNGTISGDIIGFGNPISGPSKSPLKRYRVRPVPGGNGFQRFIVTN